VLQGLLLLLEGLSGLLLSGCALQQLLLLDDSTVQLFHPEQQLLPVG
jgi:hypothetical protein